MKEPSKDWTYYLGGPMSGLPGYNYEAFNKRADELRSMGYRIINPAENFGGRMDLDYKVYITQAQHQVMEADGLMLLPGWKDSKGVMKYEIPLAKRNQKPLFDAHTFYEIPYPETCSEEAERLVNGDRQAAYSHPLDDYMKTAMMWSGALVHDLKPGHRITPEQAVIMMVQLKLSRELHMPKRDNLVDAHGYLLCLEKIYEKRKQLAGDKEEDELIRQLGEAELEYRKSWGRPSRPELAPEQQPFPEGAHATPLPVGTEHGNVGFIPKLKLAEESPVSNGQHHPAPPGYFAKG